MNKKLIIIQCTCGGQRQTLVRKGIRLDLRGYRDCFYCGKKINIKKGFVRVVGK